VNFPKPNEVCSHFSDKYHFQCNKCRVYYSETRIYLYLGTSLYWTNFITPTNVYDNYGKIIFSLDVCKDYQDLLYKINKIEIFK